LSLYKRGNTFWAVWSEAGVRHQRSTGTANRKLAERIEQQFKDEVIARQHGITASKPEMTVAALAAQFLSDGGPKFHHKDRLKHLLPFFGNVQVRQLSRGLVSQYRQMRQERDKIAPATTNRDVSVLRRVCSWGVEQGLLAVNPLTRIGMERERRIKRSVLTVADEQILLAHCAKHLRELVIAALDSGMRRGELLKQQFADVDLPRNLLFVTQSKTPEGEAREIPLTRRLADVLSAKQDKSGLVFTYECAPIKDIKRAWGGAIKRAGIRYLRFHDLRHTFNTRLMESGTIADVRMALMGHSSGADVHALYTHVELPTKRRAIAQLEAWVAEQERALAVEPTEKEKESNASSQTDAERASR
jgi:integrase